MSKGEIIEVGRQGLGLNKKMKNVRFKDAFDDESLQKAQDLIEGNRDVFLQATLDDMQELKDMFYRFSDEHMKNELARIQDLAFSIKSRATTAGYPIASSIAKLLFEFCEKKVEQLNAEKLDVAKLHMSALDQILSNEFDLDDGAKCEKLVSGLQQLTEKYSNK